MLLERAARCCGGTIVRGRKLVVLYWLQSPTQQQRSEIQLGVQLVHDIGEQLGGARIQAIAPKLHNADVCFPALRASPSLHPC